MERKLAAIVAADVVGYSRLMGEDEAGTLAALRRHREELIEPKTAQYRGRTVKLMGDGALIEFSSIVDAVVFAVEVQVAMRERNADVAENRRIVFRIGINLGDIIFERDDIHGDGVNVAARLEALAEPGGICLSRPARNQIRDKLDLDFEDLGEVTVKNIARPVRAFHVMVNEKAAALATPIVKAPTVTGRGWRPAIAAGLAIGLLGLLAVGWWRPWYPDLQPASDSIAALPATDKPSIAVLPFDNMSGDREQDYFSDGITEDLITDLSRISGLFVIARTTMFTYKGQSVKIQDLQRELGARFILEGSVRQAAGRIRINVQLIDANGGRLLWSDRFDRELTDVFAVQDEITQKIVTALAVRLTDDEQTRIGQAPQVNPEAYDMLLRGLAIYRRYTPEAILEARQFFEKAVALDPAFARGYADLALTYYYDVVFGVGSRDESIRQAIFYAQVADDMDDSLPQLQFALSDIYRMQGKHDEAIASARRAVALDPNYADGYGVLSLSLIFAGEPDAGLSAMGKAMRLNPRHPFFYVNNMGHAYFLKGQYKEAAQSFEWVIERNPDFLPARLLLASTYGQMGRIEDAKWEAEEIMTRSPGFSIAQERDRSQYKRPADLERYLEGLRKAGLPE